MYSTRKRKCPQCGGRLLWVAYGMPDDELIELSNRGEAALGGCCIPAPGEPWEAKRCAACGWSLMVESDFDFGTRV